MGELLLTRSFRQTRVLQLFTPQLSTTYPQKNGELEKEPISPMSYGARIVSGGRRRSEEFVLSRSPACGVLLGDDRQLGELGGGDADALEALGHDTVGGGEQADEQVHRRDASAAVIGGAGLGLAQQPNHILGAGLAVAHEQRLRLALL